MNTTLTIEIRLKNMMAHIARAAREYQSERLYCKRELTEIVRCAEQSGQTVPQWAYELLDKWNGE